MRFAYADPPYFGLAAKYYGHLHEAAADYDSLDVHAQLISRLCDEFADGWAMSLHSPSLKDILPLCPRECRVLAWIKPFASFKPGVRLAYAWEPIIFMGGRKRNKQQDTVRDWCAESITLQRGFIGAKPRKVVLWLLDALNVQPGDEVVDLFPGSGAVQLAIDEYLKAPITRSLFEAVPA